MHDFLQRHQQSVTGMLSGFDRIRFRGTLRLLANAGGMGAFLSYIGVLLKNFKQYVQEVTEQVRAATVALGEAAGRPLRYLASPSVNKEELAREMARRDGIDEGLICMLSSVEVLWSYDIHRNKKSRMLELVAASRKCLHYYHYLMHPIFGFMHVRLATWFPFTMHICINGREWLGRQMQSAGIAHQRRDNCFTRIDDLPAAQELMRLQLCTDWPATLEGLARQVNPVHEKIFAARPLEYYWSAEQSEWASDVMFRDSAALGRIYPGLVKHGMLSLGSREVMRFLGKRVVAGGGIDRRFKGVVVSDLVERAEGVRLKHRVNGNSIKMYDKQGSVLRVETTINDPRDLKVYRPKEGDGPDAPMKWRYLRKGVADLHRRAQVCQSANERYLTALAAVEEKRALGELSAKLCRPTRWKGQSVRALNPLGEEDAALLEAVGRGEFVINGLRNQDLRRLLWGPDPQDAASRRSRAAAATRKLRLLRAHGLLCKMPKSHRYKVSARGRLAITALLSARAADTVKLAAAA